MKFFFDHGVALQATGLILSRSGGTLEGRKVLNILGAVDRRSLLETGSPVTGSDFVGLPSFPLPWEVAFYLASPESTPGWARYIKQEGTLLTLLDDPGDGGLSDYDVRLIEETVSNPPVQPNAEDGWFWTFPPIVTAEEILRDGGVPEETIKIIAKEAEYFYQCDLFFKRSCTPIR